MIKLLFLLLLFLLGWLPFGNPLTTSTNVATVTPTTSTPTAITETATAIPTVTPMPTATMTAQPARSTIVRTYYGKASFFNANWQHVIAVNKTWGNLPGNYVGYGHYAAMPEAWGLQGKWATVSWRGRSVRVQLVDVVAKQDTASFLQRGRVIDLQESTFAELYPWYNKQTTGIEGILSGVKIEVEN